jgi:hypothetical protein
VVPISRSGRPKRVPVPPSIARHAPQRRRWVLIAAVAFGMVWLVWGGLAWGQEQQRLRKVRADIQKVIWKDNGYSELLLKVESEPSGMNYMELFSLCERSINGRNDLIVELRGLGAIADFPVVEQVIAFMGVENEWTRAKRAFYQQQLKFSVDVDVETARVLDASDKVMIWKKLSGVASSLNTSASTLSKIYQNAASQETSLASALEASGLKTERLFSKYQQGNMAVVLKTQKMVEATRTLLVGASPTSDACAKVEKPIKGLQVKDIGSSTIMVVNPSGWDEEQIERYIATLRDARSRGFLACLAIPSLLPNTEGYYVAGSIYLVDTFPADQRALEEFAVYRSPGLEKVAPFIRGQYEWSREGKEEASVGFKIGGKQGTSFSHYRRLF